MKMRIMDVLFSDEIPDPRDVVIISLAHACDIFNQLLSRADMDRAYERIEQIRKLDLIGQAMSQLYMPSNDPFPRPCIRTCTGSAPTVVRSPATRLAPRPPRATGL